MCRIETVSLSENFQNVQHRISLIEAGLNERQMEPEALLWVKFQANHIDGELIEWRDIWVLLWYGA